MTSSSRRRGSLFDAPSEVKPEAEPAPAPPPASRRAPSREGKAAVTFHIDPAAAKQLKRLALDEDTSVQALMVEALNDLFAKRGQSRIA